MRQARIFAGTLKALFLWSFLLGQSALAELYLEPFLGYSMGKYVETSEEPDASGLQMGGRVGFTSMGLSVAGEYSIMRLEIDDDPKYDLDPTNLGVFAGFEFPVLVRVYGAYLFESKADYEPSNGELSGDGFRLGIGYTGLPFVAINFEYTEIKFDKFKSSAGVSSSNDDKLKLYGVNVSVPLAL